MADFEVPLAVAVDDAPRLGHWGCTSSGRRYYPSDPRPEDFRIGDIAHALALQCRFGGHCRTFYSVAQHSVLVSRVCDPEDALWGLLHDASEAYLVDIPRPLKLQPGMEGYRLYEARMMDAILTAFGLPAHMPDSVKAADEIMLATEARDLMPHEGEAGTREWHLRHVPLEDRIQPWSWERAEAEFMWRFRDLTGT